MKKRLILFICLTMMVVLISACGEKKESKVEKAEFEPLTITDATGREVSFDKEVKKVVCIGPGALRLYTYVNGSKALVGVEEIDKKIIPDKPYLLAYSEVKDLDSIGQGGPMNSPDAEKLISIAPDVIFSTYNTDTASADELASKVGAKVVTLSTGKKTLFDKELYHSLENIGKILNKNERSKELVDYMTSVEKDLADRTKDVTPKKAYVAGIGFRGARGIYGTRANFDLFTSVNVKDYLDEVKEKAPIMIDREKLVAMDPETIFIDLNGYELAKKDYEEAADSFNSLQAIKNKKMYSILSYNSYTTNVDTAMLDTYFIGKTMYPDKFKDVDLDKKAGEIYKKLLGKDVYPEIKKSVDPFKVLEMK
ncbi:ABC transporter substrate-binding protein [Eubacteriales bacterium KG127]